MDLRRPTTGAIRVLGCAIGIHRRPVRIRMRRRRILRRTVHVRRGIASAVRLLRPATAWHRDKTNPRKYQRTELCLLSHFLAAESLCPSQLHLLLRVIRIVVRGSRQILQRLEIREHIVIFQHRQVLHHLRVRLLHINRRRNHVV